MGEKRGRSKGSRDKGCFFSSERGGIVKGARGKFGALTDEAGEPLRCEDQVEEAKLAHARWLLETGRASSASEPESVTVWEALLAYLAYAKRETAEGSFRLRDGVLFDFATGFPARFRESKVSPQPSDRLHDRYAERPVMDLKPIDIDKWGQAHDGWKNARIPIKSIITALNYAAAARIIPRNPLKGYKAPKPGSRATSITLEQERGMLEGANPQFATAIKVLIRTGARPGKKFAKLTATHVRDMGARMEWRFKLSGWKSM